MRKEQLAKLTLWTVLLALVTQSIVGCVQAQSGTIAPPPADIRTSTAPVPIPLVLDITPDGSLTQLRQPKEAAAPTVHFNGSYKQINGPGIETQCQDSKAVLVKAVCKALEDMKGLQLSPDQRIKLDKTTVLTVDGSWGRIICGSGTVMGQYAGCYITGFSPDFNDAIVIVVPSSSVKTKEDLNTLLMEIQRTTFHEAVHVVTDVPDQRALLDGTVCLISRGNSMQVYAPTTVGAARPADELIRLSDVPNNTVYGLPPFANADEVPPNANHSVQLMPDGLGAEMFAAVAELIYVHIRFAGNFPANKLIPHYLREAQEYETEYGTGRGKLLLTITSQPDIISNAVFLNELLKAFGSNNPVAPYEVIARYATKSTSATRVVVGAVIAAAEAYNEMEFKRGGKPVNDRLVFLSSKSTKQLCDNK